MLKSEGAGPGGPQKLAKAAPQCRSAQPWSAGGPLTKKTTAVSVRYGLPRQSPPCPALCAGGWKATDDSWRVTDGGWRVTDGECTKKESGPLNEKKKTVTVLMGPPGGLGAKGMLLLGGG